MAYSDLLKDPRWQKKRLEILSRDNFTCRSCGCKDKTLHVHHQYYEKNKLPWDCPSQILITLCFECHEIEEMWKQSDNEHIRLLLSNGYLRAEIARIVNDLCKSKS